MINIVKNNEYENSLLLKRFNDREPYAFGEVYSLFYKDFNYYATYIHSGLCVDSEDIIHDIFIRIWQDKDIQFKTILTIKAFVFISIKNNFKNHINHNKFHKKYMEVSLIDKNFEYDVLECEIYSYVDEALNILPSECAKVFKMYLEGFRPEEIAEMFDKKVQTVYNMKQNAISILKRKFAKDKLLLIMILLRGN